MIRSMTGYGDAQLETDANAYHVELRTVNNRYLKTSVRLPDDLAFIEPDVERLIRSRLSRGSITYRLHVRDLGEAAAAQLNEPVLRAYIAQLHALAQHPGLRVDLATLATLPGVCQPREMTDEQREQAWHVVEKLTKAALDNLIKMRTTEGEMLAKDLQTHCQRMQEALDVIEKRAPVVIEEYRVRLTSRVERLIAEQNVQLAADDLLKEVAIYADRSDISEELARLRGHLQQFATAMDGSEAAGRKLEFIAQEMLREANTIGSKTGDTEIARLIIDIKCAIDRIKEQVQNVE